MAKSIITIIHPKKMQLMARIDDYTVEFIPEGIKGFDQLKTALLGVELGCIIQKAAMEKIPVKEKDVISGIEIADLLIHEIKGEN